MKAAILSFRKRFSNRATQLEFACRLLDSGKKEPTEIDRMRAAIVGFSEDKGKLILRLSSMSNSDLKKTSDAYFAQYDSSLPIDLFCCRCWAATHARY